MYNFNPYGQNQYSQFSPQPQLNTYAFVNGLEGAKAYQVSPNQTVILIDSENSYLYVKQANSIGQANIQYFKLIQLKETELNGPVKEYVTREEFNKFIEEMKNNGKSVISNSEPGN